MKELQTLFNESEAGTAVKFDHLNHRVRCYAHIINLCSFRVIQSMTSLKKYRVKLQAVLDDTDVFYADSDSESEDGNIDRNCNIEELDLDKIYDDDDDAILNRWYEGVKRNPLERARGVIRILRSSDKRREGLANLIRDGNARKWFFVKDEYGKRKQTKVPKLQPLRDVKMRWDSVYMMLERLRVLRPVSSSRLSDWTMKTNQTLFLM